MKKFILFISVLSMALGLASSLKADHQDPDSNKWKIASIRWVKENSELDHKDIDFKYLVLIGKVTDRIDEDTYRLNDGTGTILLDVDEDEIELPVGKRVVVRGEVDEAYWDIGELELNVVSWRPENKRD
jgi:uncharacterized protein YdeI (BOF family)